MKRWPILEVTGRVIQRITGANRGSDKLTVFFEDGSLVEFVHDGWCCEYVAIQGVTPGFPDAIGETVLGIDVSETSVKMPMGIWGYGNPWAFDTWTKTRVRMHTTGGWYSIFWVGSPGGCWAPLDIECRFEPALDEDDGVDDSRFGNDLEEVLVSETSVYRKLRLMERDWGLRSVNGTRYTRSQEVFKRKEAILSSRSTARHIKRQALRKAKEMAR